MDCLRSYLNLVMHYKPSSISHPSSTIFFINSSHLIISLILNLFSHFKLTLRQMLQTFNSFISLYSNFMIVYSPFFKKEFNIAKAQHIGEGNFAQVYRVYDSDINDSLAIRKVTINMGEGEDIEKEKVINQELKRVDNQNILKIYDIIESADSIWYITEYCEGGSLWDALNDCMDNKMNEKDALQCIYQISKGVQELHNHRITHRDLKPENILLKTRYIPGKPIPVIKIADFGLSTKKIIMETIAGTKQYIAPEQARFHNYTNAVDVWSLGIIFDQILHGTPFYVGDNNKEVFQKILKTPYKVRDSKLRESIKEFLVMILKKKPYERPIIAVICQNIQKILDEIQCESGSPMKSEEKKEMRKVKIHEDSMRMQREQMQLASFRGDKNTRGSRFQRKVTGVNNEEKQRTPFKKTMRIPEEEQQNNDKKIRSARQEESNTRSRGKQTNFFGQSQEDNKKEHLLSSEKLNIYKIEKKKTQMMSLNKDKQKFEQNVIDIGEYVSETYKLKQSIKSEKLMTIVSKQRQFMPSAHMNLSDMPEKLNLDNLLQEFRGPYDFLNTVAYDDEYQSKLHKGKNSLQIRKGKFERGLNEYKGKIRQAFLGQIDKYIDSYIDKVLE